jgi:alpha-galactosidase
VDERGDLPFRLRVAMLGSFGISARADLWPAADFAVAAAHVALYRDSLRALIHHGDQYLLTPAPTGDDAEWAAIWYVAKDGSAGVLFAFRLAGAEASRTFPMPGLTPGVRYRARRFDGASLQISVPGLTVTVPEQFRSELVLVEKAA